MWQFLRSSQPSDIDFVAIESCAHPHLDQAHNRGVRWPLKPS